MKKRLEVANVIPDEKRPIERNILASAIVEMSAAMKKLLASGLTREALVVLCHHRVKPTSRFGAKPGMADIRAVMNAMTELERDFCK